ncbi:MAG TPA: FxLYD domain-containing protein [Acidimicrobiales bacterium]|nr:FxLYD domain-containing protein [Acidimicrobiales bacterium]
MDARPARLVSMLRGGGGSAGGGAAVVTAQREGGDTVTRVVPPAARQVTFQVHGPLQVEATPGSDFVALAEEGGRRVVVAFNGEVTVLPTGSDGDRFALGAHEALLVPADGGDPRVVPVDDLSDEDQDEISAVMEGASLAPSTAATATPATPPATSVDEPTQQVAAATAGAGGAGAANADPAKKPSGQVPAKAVGNAQKRNQQKKGKKGRPAQQAKKAAPLVPAATTAGAGVRKASTPSTPPTTPVKKSTGPAKKATSGKAVATAVHDESYEDTPGDRRFIIGAIALAVVIAVVLAIFVRSSGDDKADVAADATTTTSATDESTTASTEAPSTTVAVTTTSTAKATTTAVPTTTAKATTTTAAKATTTSAPAPAVKYGIEPKSCVQNANNSITYTATITNQSTAAFDYTVRVVFKDANNTSVATADANVTKLAAGKSVDFTATGTPNRSLANAGQCTVERVDAKASA